MKNCVFTILALIEIFNKNLFIDECAIKKKAKISEPKSFLVRYRRTYVLKTKTKKLRERNESYKKILVH